MHAHIKVDFGLLEYVNFVPLRGALGTFKEDKQAKEKRKKRKEKRLTVTYHPCQHVQRYEM